MAQSDDSLTDTDNILTVPEVTIEKGTLDFRDQNGEISGNVYAGAVVHGDRDVRIGGTVSGNPQHRCVIEVGGTVEIASAVTGARIQAGKIVIRGDVEDSTMQSDLDVEVRGNLGTSQVTLGGQALGMQKLRQMQVEARQAEQELAALRLQTRGASRRFIRDYAQVELQMGDILKIKGRELVVSLKSFYTALRTDDPRQVDQALEEFYLRVVVGLLTRNNRHYISRNPSRHKIFLKLIEDLRKHVLDIRQEDKYQDEVHSVGQRSSELIRALTETPCPELVVGGVVEEGVSLQILHLEAIEILSSGDLDSTQVRCEVKVVETEQGVGLEDHSSGEVRPVAEGSIENGRFRLQDQSIIWVPK